MRTSLFSTIGIAGLFAASAVAAAEPPPLPERLSDTGLFEPGSTRVRAENLAYAPQYTLWSDGASKRRWLYLPPGRAIDAREPDRWDFPPGTRLWKEFSHDVPVETRMLERLESGEWRYSVYVWEASGRDAVLAPEAGMSSLPAPGAPGGRYVIPSRADCRACHEGAAVPVLGVSALQLSPDRDPGAPNAEPATDERMFDLDDLLARGLVTGLPASYASEPPRIRGARSATERSVLGYLHANCGHCHNGTDALSGPDLILSQSIADDDGLATVLDTMIGRPGEFRHGELTARLVPGYPAASLLSVRMASRNPIVQMPPLGSRIVDREAVALLERWIREELPNH